MSLYLPIAELPLSLVVLLAIGGGVGFLSGLFGVGGGFLITPLLMFFGVPPAVAAASGATTVIAPSVSGVLAHWRRGNVDFRMGALLLAGGLVGSTASVGLSALLQRIGQIDLVVALSYVLLLGAVGVMMLVESARARRRRTSGERPPRRAHLWIHGLPAKMRFPRSRLYVSSLVPVGVGFVVGILAGIMGVGGGFLLVPAMIYLIGMPTAVVVGTSLFQIVFVSANVTFLQAWGNQAVDILLAAVVTVGGLIGSPYGARLGARLKADQMRSLMALLVLAVAAELGAGLVVTPHDPYSIEVSLVPGPPEGEP
jgi:hypothetical protein